MKKIQIIFVPLLMLLVMLMFAGCDSTDYVPVVQNGYLGEYTDMTVKEFFSGYYGKEYDEETWGGGVTDDGKEIVEVKFSDKSEDKEDAVIQFEMLDEERFKILAFSDPQKPRKDSAERLVTFNTMYIEQYASTHPELHEDVNAVQAFLSRLGKISGSSIRCGASAEYSGERGKLEEAAGETPIGLSVVEMLDASDVNVMDYFTDKLIKMVQEGHLGEYTDMTVQELLSGNAVTIAYDEEIWTSHTSESGAKVVEVLYPAKDEIFEDIKIQFTMLNDECFKVTAYEDADYPVKKNTDLTAKLNYFYLTAYCHKHQEIVGTDEETKFIKSLERIDGFTVQYGASADYKGDRRKICEIAGDLPTEGTVVELLDSSGLFDVSFYYQEDESDEDEPEEPDMNGFTDSGKYPSVQAFLDDPDVAEMLEEEIAGLGEDMIVDISAEGDSLIYLFLFTEDVDEEYVGKELLKMMNEPDFASVFEDIAASLSDTIEVSNPSVIVAYGTTDGTPICYQEYFPSY